MLSTEAKRTLCLTVVVAAFSSTPVRSDEGMWLMNEPPTELLQEHYGFVPHADWLEHVQKSCIRYGGGASASIVSSDGLVMTNHHVGFGQLQKLSTPEHNLLKTGFYARTRDEELRCQDLELKVLWSIEDVTDRVNAAVDASLSAADAHTARRASISRIENDSKERTGLTSEVVTLYHGARFHLYRYRRYTDVRLVFAPEGDIAHFGGDTDNFEYPRYCLDVTFFRIYEDGKPLRPEHYLKWSDSGASDGDLTFIVGHPYRTERLFTVDHVKFLRDRKLPTILRRLWRREVKALNFSARSDEHARMARMELGGAQNSRKAFTGIMSGVLDPEFMRRKRLAEREVRSTVGSTPEYKAQWAGAWARIAKAQRVHAEIYERYTAVEGRRNVFRSDLLGIAWQLVRLTEELQKPDGQRLEEYRDAALDSLYLDLYSPAPIYPELEIANVESGLLYLAETIGTQDPLTRVAMGDLSPRARAESLVQGTQLADVSVRKRLAESGAEAVRNSSDPMIRLAVELDPIARKLRKRYEDEVESVEREAYAKIAAATFTIKGSSVPPDATSSLRLSYGPIKPYEENGNAIPSFTDIAGLYERYKTRRGEKPFNLPESWLDARDKLDLSTPFNFVCTADIIGGNSGSPVIDRRGEVIGIVFDGNLQGLVWDLAYTDDQARAVCVDSRAIIEALRNVYNASALADELTGKK